MDHSMDGSPQVEQNPRPESDSPQSSVKSTTSSIIRHQPPPTLGPRHPCPLFRLPPELREPIWDELLLYNETEPNKILYPQILTTCRDLHAECRPRLEGQNFKTTMLARIRFAHGEELTIRYGSEASQRIVQPTYLVDALCAFEPICSGMPRLAIMLNLNVSFDTDWKTTARSSGLNKVQFQLYLLVTQALVSKNVKHIDLKIKFGTVIPSEGVTAILDQVCRPVRQLGNRIALRVHGVDSEMDKLLHAPIRATRRLGGRLGVTGLWHWLQVRKAVEELTDLTMRAGLYDPKLELLLRSLCHAWRVERLTARYDHIETNMNEYAYKALWRLTEDSLWRELRSRAESRLASAGS